MQYSWITIVGKYATKRGNEKIGHMHLANKNCLQKIQSFNWFLTLLEH